MSYREELEATRIKLNRLTEEITREFGPRVWDLFHQFDMFCQREAKLEELLQADPITPTHKARS